MTPTPESRHIMIDRLWAYSLHEGPLTLAEDAHLFHCEPCIRALSVCLTADTLDAALTALVAEAPADDQAA